MKRRMLAILLFFSLGIGIIPTSVLAEPIDAVSCIHHSEHTPECGAVSAEESEAFHEHTEECYESVEVCIHEHTEECYPEVEETDPEETISDEEIESIESEAYEPTECIHVCSVESGCITITDHLICGHGTEESDSDGSEDTSEGICNFVCAICPLQDRIDALPSIESLEGMDETQRDGIFAEIEAIFASIDELTHEEAVQLDRTRLDAAASFFQEVSVEEFSSLENDYTVPAIHPNHVQIDLFDYWLYDRDQTDCQKDPTIPGADGWIHNWKDKAFFAGINEGHALMFQKGGLSGDNGSFNSWTKSNGAAWLRSDGSGIVSRELVDDYPVLNLTETEVKKSFDIYDQSEGVEITAYPDHNESLNYLFDPNIHLDYKAGYEDVKGLFQMDEDGNYYYDSKKNFAEFDEDTNWFKLYNQCAVKKSDDASINGQFFPFNTGDQVFKEDPVNQTIDGTQRECRDAMMNHYFGMTMTAQFQQPNKGMLSNTGNSKPMQFTFSGDDDVWIFIDGVLVADLGGIHDPMTTTIDFSTGNVVVKRISGNGPVINTTIKAQFDKAGKTDVAFDEETFADQTVHELKMFYLERGNVASNLSLSFNLMEANYSELIKTDQNGDPLGGVSFDLFEADNDFNVSGDAIASFVVDDSGYIDLATMGADGKKHPISLTDGGHYVLRETEMPAGYVPAEDIHLIYSRDTNTLRINNQWETGAVGRFKTQIIQNGKMEEDSGLEIDKDTAKKGLILAVPLLSPSVSTGEDSWHPVCGSTMAGFSLVEDYDPMHPQKAALEAALRQIADPENERWHLAYNEQLNRFEGVLQDLPGSADRYRLVNAKGDLHIAYYLLEDVDGDTDEEKIANIAAVLSQGGPDALDANIEAFINEKWTEMKLLDAEDFQRQFYTQLYIPNKVRDLWINKVDENGGPLSGAEFTLYEDEACTAAAARGITDENGNISFSAQNPGGNAVTGSELSSLVYFPLDLIHHSDGTWSERSYWLKETNAPEGYVENDTVIEVRVTNDSLYVNAGTADDGVSAVKGMGKLLQTMVEFASDDVMNITLRDIKATKYTYDGQFAGDDLPAFGAPDWEKTDEVLNLHYGLDKALMDYGVHDPDAKPYFEAEEGWMGFDIKQNYDAHTDPGDPYGGAGYKEDLSGIDISALLTGSTAVVVKNNRETGALTLSKNVSGNAGDRTKFFNFEITLADGNGQPLSNSFEYIGASSENGVNPPASGVLTFDAAGVANISLSHGQSITIAGLLPGTTYTVTESEANQDGYITTSTGAQGTITADGAEVAFINTKDIEETDESQETEDTDETDETEEIEETGSLTVSKVVAGNAGDPNRSFNFTVTLDEQSIDGVYGDMTFEKGVAVFALKDGESKMAVDLPTGIAYTVVEREANQDGYITTYVGQTGSIRQEGSAVSVTNTKNDTPVIPDPSEKVGNLVVSKTVSGDGAERDRSFTFKVLLDDPSIEGNYGDMAFHKGVAVFTLKHGESQRAEKLPAGVTYTVAESENEGYYVTYTGDTGKIQEGVTVTAAFNNHKDLKAPEIEETETEKPEESAKPDESVPPTSDNDAPATGDMSNLRLVIGIMVISAIIIIGICVFVLLQRKGKKHKK